MTSSSNSSSAKSEFDRRRYHSTPPESTVGHSKSTPPQASLADSRVQPIAVGVASSSGQGPAYRHRVNSDTAVGLGRPESPHSPVVRKQASLHLAGIIGRQQERERSCTPSPRTPTLTKFSFPIPDVGDSNNTSKAAASITVTESTLPSEKAARLMNLGNSSAKQSVATTDSCKVAANDGGHPPQKPKAFAEGLKFIDTPEIPDDGPDATPKMATSSSSSVPAPGMTTTTAATPSTKAAKSPAKTQIVFRPLDEVHAEDITVISGCKFFDPSQSQADYYTPPPPLHQISSVSESRGEGDKIVEGKDKGKKAKSKDSKSSSKLKRKNSSGKMIESTPELEEKAGDSSGGGGDETPKIELKFSKKKEKEEKAGKKSSPKKKRSISMSEADVGTGSLPLSLPASPSKPPLPISANAKSGLKKTSASFRGDGRDHSLSPENTGGLVMNKLGTPNLSSPVHSSSRGTTPDSTTSESENYKRTSSLRNKLKSLMGKDKSNGKAVRTSWRFSDLGGVAQHDSEEVVSLKGFRKLSEDGEEELPSLTPIHPVHPAHPVHHTKSYSLSSMRSTSQISLLTHADRLNMEEDTEMVPRTYSMECIYPSYNERCVDVPAIGEKLNDSNKSTNSGGSPTKKDADGDSGSSEYMTASDSGSVNRLTAEAAISEPQLLSVPATNSSVNLSQDTTSEKFVTPPESTGHSQTSMELSVIEVMDKAFSSMTDAGVNSKLKSKASPSPKTNSKKSAIGTTTTKGPSPRSSPITSRKASSKLASPLGRKVPGTPSPIMSKKSSSATPSSPSPVKKSSFSSSRISPKTSPVSARSSLTGKKATTSPLAQRRVAATTTASPGSSPVSSRKSTSAKASLTTSPLSARRVSPSKPPTASPKSSPSLTRKIAPGSPRSSFGMKPSPPKLSRAPLDSASSPKLSPRKSSFSRFSQGRTPFKVKAISKDESPEEKMQRIRERRKSLSDSKLLHENISASCPTTPQASRSKPEPPSDLTLSQPTRLGSESPHRTSSISPTSPRRRKLGVSMAASPLVEIPPTLPEVRTPSPNAQPLPVAAAHKNLKTETSGEDDRPATKTSTELEFDVESLLSSVGTQLDQLGGGEEIATKQPLKLEPVENPPDIASMPAMVFTSPIHSRQSSYDIEGEHDDIPTSPLEQTALKQKLSAPSPPVTAAATAAGKNSKSPSSTKKSASTSLAPKSPSATRKLTEPTPSATKKSKSGIKSLRTRLNIPSSKGSSKDQLSPVLEKKESPKTSPTALKKKASAPLSTGKSEPAQKFTSARPPRPPLMSRLPSDPTIPSHRISSEARPSTAPTSAATTSSTGQKRPRNIVTARPSTAGATSAQKPPPGPSSSSSDSMKSKSSSSLSVGSNKSLPGRGGLRASGRAKRISTTTHSTPPHNARPSLAAESSLHHTNAGRHSIKSKSAVHILAASGTTRKSSLTATEVEKTSPARKSVRRVSSGEMLPRKIKPGASATLTRERKISQASSSASGGGSSSIQSLGKSNTLTRPRSASNAGLNRTSVTRSMRLSRGSSSRKSSTTAPRAPMLTRKATPPSTGGLLSPTRKNSTMKRTSSGGEVLAAFDHISAQAQGSM